MSAKRFSSLGVMLVLLAFALIGGGCATTHSQDAEYKPHKPQMITGDEEREGIKLPDPIANTLSFLSQFWGR
jgi:hypothetical protein